MNTASFLCCIQLLFLSQKCPSLKQNPLLRNAYEISETLLHSPLREISLQENPPPASSSTHMVDWKCLFLNPIFILLLFFPFQSCVYVFFGLRCCLIFICSAFIFFHLHYNKMLFRLNVIFSLLFFSQLTTHHKKEPLQGAMSSMPHMPC